MTNPEQSNSHDYYHALTEINQASTEMVRSTDVPPGFQTVFVGLVATLLTLIGLVSWSIMLVIATLTIPLMPWYFFYMRKPVIFKSGETSVCLGSEFCVLLCQFGGLVDPGSCW